LVHAYHVPFEGFVTPAASPSETTDLRKEYRAAAASRVAKLQQSLADHGVACEAAVVRGDPRTVIVNEVARRRADLLVVGTHRRSGIARALIGSVAEWVIQAAASDVLVARGM
jgi:nucleotide-binding universal stress UspA family protein